MDAVVGRMGLQRQNWRASLAKARWVWYLLAPHVPMVLLVRSLGARNPP